MKPATVPRLIILAIGIAFVGAGAFGTEATEAARTAEPKPDTAAEPKAEKTKEFKPPLGFVTKKRGKHVLYCKRDSVVGTRFKTEKCYSEAQMRDYMIAQEENKRDIDRVRSVCSNLCTCGQPEAC